MRHFKSTCAAVMLLSVLPCALAAPPEAASLILRAGKVRTSSGAAEAMAVDRKGVIIAVGSTKEIDALRDAGTKVIDLEGRTVLPGLHDMHVHPVFAGLQARRCVIPQGSALPELQRLVKACVARARPGEWITGGQWDASAIARTPHRAMLDAVSPQNPILLGDTSEHSAWANSKALELAGITRKTRTPAGGIIERDAAGEPTGVLREAAVMLVRERVPLPTAEDVRSALSWSLQKMLSYGITSFTEAAAGYSSTMELELGAYAALADSGTLKQRVRLCLPWQPDSGAMDEVLATRSRYVRERLSPDCVKIFLDGVPTDSHTAAMLEPYEGKVEGREDDASRRGMLAIPQDELNRAVTHLDRMGLAVKFHAAGDAAVRAGLTAIEAARKANGYSGRLHDVGHCTFVAASDIPRAKAIAATYEVSPYLWGPSPINDDIAKAVGSERIRRVWPVKEMIDSGALVIPGSDWSVVPSVNPWPAIEMLVTRERPGGSEDAFGKVEAITLEQAMDIFTINPARHLSVANTLGRIEPGMIADVIVVDRDPFSTPVRSLHEISVLKTLINGEVVYERAP